MKILMVCEFFQENIEYQENLFVDSYLRNGHDVTVICSLYDDVFSYYKDLPVAGNKTRQYNYNGATIIKMPYRYNILHKLRAYPNITPVLEDKKPDLIYVHDIMLNFPECIRYVRSHPATKMIMDYHADYANSGKNWISLKILHGLFRKWFLDRARPHLQKIFPIVPHGADFLHEVYGVPYSEMEILPLPADLDAARIAEANGVGPKLRQKLGIAPDDFVIFTGGKLDPLKKTEHLIQAFNSVDAPNSHLLIIGASDGDRAEYRRSLDRAAAGNPRIHFCGWLDKAAIHAHMYASNVAVFPASQSVIWQQAIGMGLPLVVGDRSELIRGHQDASYLNIHENMIILDPTKPTAQELEKALRRLLSDPALLQRMSIGARSTARELLDADKLTARTLRYNQSPGGVR